MPRFRRTAAAAVLALTLPLLGWIGDRIAGLWQVVVAVTAASASGDAPEPESPRAPESLNSSSAGPEEEDDTGKLDPNG